MSLFFTIVVTIFNLIVAIIQCITIERKIKLQYLIISSKKKTKSNQKKKTTQPPSKR